MKKIITFSMLVMIANSTFSQQTNPVPELSKQDYLQKSKKQKTAAWIMLGGGTSLMIIGIASVSTEEAGSFIFGGDQSGFNTGLVLFSTGIIAVGGSIPLFIASGKNKKRAMSLSFKMFQSSPLQNINFVSRPTPALSLKMDL